MPDDIRALEREEGANKPHREAPAGGGGAAGGASADSSYLVVESLGKRALAVPYSGLGGVCQRRFNDPEAQKRWALDPKSDEALGLGGLFTNWVQTRVRLDPNSAPGFFFVVALGLSLGIRAFEQMVFVLNVAWDRKKDGARDGQEPS